VPNSTAVWGSTVLCTHTQAGWHLCGAHNFAPHRLPCSWTNEVSESVNEVRAAQQFLACFVLCVSCEATLAGPVPCLLRKHVVCYCPRRLHTAHLQGMCVSTCSSCGNAETWCYHGWRVAYYVLLDAPRQVAGSALQWWNNTLLQCGSPSSTGGALHGGPLWLAVWFEWNPGTCRVLAGCLACLPRPCMQQAASIRCPWAPAAGVAICMAAVTGWLPCEVCFAWGSWQDVWCLCLPCQQGKACSCLVTALQVANLGSGISQQRGWGAARQPPVALPSGLQGNSDTCAGVCWLAALPACHGLCTWQVERSSSDGLPSHGSCLWLAVL
jgi:hypothetical protein